LESVAPERLEPLTALKFDLVNEGSSRLTNIVLEVSIVKKPPPGEFGATTPVEGTDCHPRDVRTSAGLLDGV
jgi:hypothetical protein